MSTVGSVFSDAASISQSLQPAVDAARACIPAQWLQVLSDANACTLAMEQPGEPIPFHPQLWACGVHVLPEYVVQEGCSRCVLVRAMAQDDSLVPGQPLRPRIWEDVWQVASAPETGLRGPGNAAQRASGPPARARLASERTSVGSRRSRPRPMPLRRVFDSALPACAASALIDADVDPLRPPVAADRLPWSPVWRRLADIELDRAHRVLAWRILHNSLYCGAFMLRARRTDAAGVACPHHCCAGVVQSLSHLFLTCPLASTVWAWLREIWASISGGTRPPAALSVLLADDGRVWHPPPRLCALWTRLRLAVLHALWSASCQARHGQVPADARGVTARVLSYCRGLMVQHWFRVDLRRPDLGACPHWLLARNPALTLEMFQDWWCASGVLCRVVSSGAKPRMQVIWDANVPVPLPPALDRARHYPPGSTPRHPDVDLGGDMDLDEPDDFD